MATEEVVETERYEGCIDRIRCIVLSKKEAVSFIAFLTAQAVGEGLTGRSPEAPSLSIEDKGHVLYRLVMTVDRGGLSE